MSLQTCETLRDPAALKQPDAHFTTNLERKRGRASDEAAMKQRLKFSYLQIMMMNGVQILVRWPPPLCF